MKLYYHNLSQKWEDGLPVGNGRLAAMLWGAQDEIISLNHEWIWTGDFKHRENQKSAHFLPYVREYLNNKDFFRANALAALAFGGNGGISPLERRMDSYQPAGDLRIEYKENPTETFHTLDLETGTAESRREFAGYSVSSSVYCDCSADVVSYTLQSTKSVDFTFKFIREPSKHAKTACVYKENGFEFNADLGEGVSFAVKATIKTDGAVKVSQGSLLVCNATHFSVTLNIGTAHAGIEKELAKTDLTAYDKAAAYPAHCAKFSAAMNRCTIEVCPNDEHAFLNERVAKLRESKKTDPQLFSRYAAFAQYMLVAGSICAELPLNLQGKWNRDLAPKWNSDYHFNINIQMNYWFSDGFGYAEYTKQMLEYARTLLPAARKAAMDLYGCRGILYPLNSDIWANSTAEAYNYAVWIAAAGWLCQHFVRYYVYTGDADYLRTAIYPFIRETVQFYEDYFVQSADGTLNIMPSQSPENKFEGGGYFPVSVCANSAMDVQIAYDTFRFAVFAAKELGVDKADCARWQDNLTHFPPFAIGKDGRLLEWDSDDKIEIEKGHRHASHLFGVYPASLFTPETRTEQFEAAKKSLAFRLENSGGHTGWSCAWSACLSARFLDGASVSSNLNKLITSLSSETLLDLHPNYYPQDEKSTRGDTPSLFTKPVADPPMIFQIDGNLGAAAALAEALVQVRDGVIYLLPARDKSWTHGRVNNLRLPFGNIISFAWDESGITSLSITLGFRKSARFAPVEGADIPQIISGSIGEAFILIGENS